MALIFDLNTGTFKTEEEHEKEKLANWGTTDPVQAELLRRNREYPPPMQYKPPVSETMNLIKGYTSAGEVPETRPQAYISQGTPSRGLLSKLYRGINIATEAATGAATLGLAPLIGGKLDDLLYKGMSEDKRQQADIIKQQLRPTPESTFERGIQIGGGLVGGALGGLGAVAGAKSVAKAFAPTAKTVAQARKVLPQALLKALGIGAAATAYQVGKGATIEGHAEKTGYFPAEVGAGLRTGTGQLLATAGYALEHRGLGGEKIVKAGEKITEGFTLEPVEFTWQALLDPHFYSRNVTQTVPMTAALIPFMVAGWYVGKGVGARLSLGPFGEAILGSLAGAGLSRPLESSLEAAGIYQETMMITGNKQLADQRADEVFRRNMALVGLDMAQLALAFAPAPARLQPFLKTTKGKIISGMVKLGGEAGTEGIEEGIQEAIQLWAKDEKFSFHDPDVQEAMVIGAIFGLTMGGAGVVKQMYHDIQEDTIRQLPDEAAVLLAQSVMASVESGMSEDEALEVALGELAKTEQGAVIIKQITDIISREYIARAAQDGMKAILQGNMDEIRERAKQRWGERAEHEMMGEVAPPPAEAPPTAVPPTEVPPAEVPPTEVPPTEVPPAEVPPAEIPPAEVPPTEVPPTEVPPTAVPPTEVPPAEVPPAEVPPTEVPPTEVPPAAVPPTAAPPTAVPPTAAPPTAAPPTARVDALNPGEVKNVPIAQVDFQSESVKKDVEGSQGRVDLFKHIIQTGEDYRGFKASDILAPIRVKPAEGGRYKTHDGNHRLQAYKQLGYTEVPITLYEAEETTKTGTEGEVGKNVFAEDVSLASQMKASFDQAAKESGLTPETVQKYTEQFTDEITDAMLQSHGLSKKDGAYVAGKSSVSKEGNVLRVSVELLTKKGSAITQEILHEWAEVWTSLWKSSNPEEYNKVVDFFVGKGLSKERAEEHIPEIMTDYVLSQELPAGAEADAGRKVVVSAINKLKQTMKAVMERLVYFKQKIWGELPPELQQQAKLFKEGKWEEVLKSLPETIEGTYAYAIKAATTFQQGPRAILRAASLRYNAPMQYVPNGQNSRKMRSANTLAKALIGRELIVFRGEPDDIQGFTEGLDVYINENAINPIHFVLMHEATHVLESSNPSSYKKLFKLVMEYFNDNPAMIEHYARWGYTVGESLHEFTADVMSEVMGQDGFWEMVREKAPRLVRDVIDLIDMLIARIKTEVDDKNSVLKYIKDLEQFKNKVAGVIADDIEARGAGFMGAGKNRMLPSEVHVNLKRETADSDLLYRERTDPPPKKTILGYKLFRVDKNGGLHPLFIDRAKTVPQGIWIDAEHRPTKGYADRPGWHLGELPWAPHIGAKGPTGNVELRRHNEVWAECEFAADISYQEEANKNGVHPKTKNFNPKQADIKRVPQDGYYRVRMQSGLGRWVISGSIKINRIMSDEEVDRMVRAAGYDPMPRQVKLKRGREVTPEIQRKLDEASEVAQFKIHYAPYAMDRAPFQVADEFARLFTGRGIIPFTSLEKSHGMEIDGQIFLNSRSRQPLLYIVSHEIGHTLQRDFPGYYEQIKKIALEHVADTEGLKDHYVKKYKYETSEVPDELTSDVLAECMTDESFWQRVKEVAPKMLRQILSVIDDILNRGKDFADVPAKYQVAKYLKDVETMRDKIAAVYAEYLQEVRSSEYSVKQEGYDPILETYKQWTESEKKEPAKLTTKAIDAAMQDADFKEAWTFKSEPDNKGWSKYYKTVNVWSKSGKYRVYVPSSPRDQAGYVTLDKNDVRGSDSGEYRGMYYNGDSSVLLSFIDDLLDVIIKREAAKEPAQPITEGLRPGDVVEGKGLRLIVIESNFGGDANKFYGADIFGNSGEYSASDFAKTGQNVTAEAEAAETAKAKEPPTEQQPAQPPQQPVQPRGDFVDYTKSVTDAQRKKLDEAAEAAMARIKRRSKDFNALPVDILLDYAIIGASKMAKQALNFVDFSAEMVQMFGEGIRPHLQAIWDQSKVIMTVYVDQIDALTKGREDIDERQSTESTGETNQGTLGKTPAEDASGVTGTGGTKPTGTVPGDHGGEGSTRDGRRTGGDDTTRGEPGGKDATGDHGAADRGGRGDEAIPSGERTGGDYEITSEDHLGEGGLKTKFKGNVAAIKLLKKLAEENRMATKNEQAILVKYVGWGGMPQAFDATASGEAANAKWAKEFNELKELLTEEEYTAASNSTQFAHYTSEKIIKAIWAGLERLGFTGGRILEPAMGIGHFYGLMPGHIRSNSQLSGVEIDIISGNIARHLYQGCDIRVMGYEDFAKVNVEFGKGLEKQPLDDYYDLIISNVPFSSTVPYDPRYNKHKFVLHDYFFAKSLDKVRPGGLIAFITSRGTLDKMGKKARQYIMDRADVVGAMRLPYTAFKDNANTEVVTDLIILKKREPGTPYNGVPILRVDQMLLPNEEGRSVPVEINEHYVLAPENVLGELSASGKLRYRGELTVMPLDKPLEESIAERFAEMPEGAYEATATQQVEEESFEVPEENKGLPDGSLLLEGNKVVYKVGDKSFEYEHSPKNAPLLRAYIGLRDSVLAVIDAQVQGKSDKEVKSLQNELSKLYDTFVKDHGPLSLPANKAKLDDPMLDTIMAIEDYDAAAKTAKKTAFFTERTISHDARPTKAEHAEEAMLISLAETGRLNWKRMTELLGREKEEIAQELRESGLIYLDPESNTLVTADDYLSGNVRRKLLYAEEMVADDPTLEINVAALKKVQPVDLTPNEITFKLGASWIPASVLSDFINEHLLWVTSEVVTVAFVPQTGAWHVDWEATTGSWFHSAANRSQWGTYHMGCHQILKRILNNQDIIIRVKDDHGNYVTDEKATRQAQMKAAAIKEEFSKWILETPKLANQLTDLYNWEINNTANRQYDGSHLKFPGKSKLVNLYKHQVDAVWRMLAGGNTLLAHVVGAGKTFTMIAAAMEAKRMGLARKSMVVVPNHLVEQWTKAWKHLYPGAKILVLDTSNLPDVTFAQSEQDTEQQIEVKKAKHSKARQLAVGKIATGNWDAVIVPFTAFTRLPVSIETQREFIRQQMADLEHAIRIEKEQAREGGGKQKSITKLLENQLDKLKNELEKLVDEVDSDIGIPFEQLGIDRLFVDESHGFKNIWFPTKMGNIAGVTQSNAQRAVDMLMKCQWLNKVTREKGVVWATGTPISNSMVEMFNLQRCLQPSVLADRDIGYFDLWASTFAEVVPSIEKAVSGNKYQITNRLSKFINVPELMQIFAAIADVRTGEDIEEYVKRPKLKTGGPIAITCEEHPLIKDYCIWLAGRAKEILNAMRDRDMKYLSFDNMLLVTNDARKAALDMRLFDATLPEYEHNKVNKCADKVFEIWKNTKKQRSTQLIFADLGVPTAAPDVLATGENEEDMLATLPEDALGSEIYLQIKQKLMKMGVPAKEIAFIHDAKTKEAKALLFDKVNSGEVRVLIGSTHKCGTGMNAQGKMIALHNLDVPWKPADLEQRIGRIWRQGNENEEIEVYNYVAEGSFDVRSWNILMTKAKFINQLLRSKDVGREVVDEDAMVLSYEEMMALATGDPRDLMKMDLDRKMAEMEARLKEHQQGKYSAEKSKENARINIDLHKKNIAETERQLAGLKETKGDKFEIKFKDITSKNKKGEEVQITTGGVYKDRKEAGAQLYSLVKGVLGGAKISEYTKVGEFAGLPFGIVANTINGTCEIILEGAEGKGFNVQMQLSEHPNPDGRGLLASLERQAANLVNKYTQWRKNAIDALEKDIETFDKMLERDFADQKAYDDLIEQRRELYESLGIQIGEDGKVPQEELERAKQESERKENEEIARVSQSEHGQRWDEDLRRRAEIREKKKEEKARRTGATAPIKPYKRSKRPPGAGTLITRKTRTLSNEEYLGTPSWIVKSSLASEALKDKIAKGELRGLGTQQAETTLAKGGSGTDVIPIAMDNAGAVFLAAGRGSNAKVYSLPKNLYEYFIRVLGVDLKAPAEGTNENNLGLWANGEKVGVASPSIPAASTLELLPENYTAKDVKAAIEKAKADLESAGEFGETTVKSIQAFQKGSAKLALRYTRRQKPLEQSTVMKKHEIIKFLEDKLLIPIRKGRYHAPRGVIGIFKPVINVVRTRKAEDIEVIMHEVGHFLDQEIGLQAGAQYDAEMQALKRVAGNVGKPVAIEGVADFIRYYVIDVDVARRTAPRYFEWFENKMQDHPEVLQILEEARTMWETWELQPAKAAVLGSLSVGQGTPRKPINLERTYTFLVDELHPLKKFVDTITKGTTIAAEDNPFLLAWLARGWTGKARAWLFGGQFVDGKKVGRSLDEILNEAEIDGSLDDFRAFATSTRAIELHARDIETGLEEIAEQCLEDMKAELGEEQMLKFERTFKEIVKYQNRVLTELVRAGVLNKETAKTIFAANANYVPFYRLVEESESSSKHKGKTFANLGTPIKRLKGSTRTIVDPIESIIKNTYAIINIAERNKVGRALVELAEKFPEGTGKWVEKVAPPKHGTSFALGEIEETLRDAGVDTGGVDLQAIATVFRPNYNVPRVDNLVTIFRNGEREFYQLDKDLYRSMMFLDETSSNILLQIASYPTQLLRAGATLTVDFIMKNPFRDQYAAFVYGKYKYIPFVDLFRGLAHVIKRDDLYWEFYSSGAAHGAFVSVDRDYLQGDLRKMIQNRTKQLGPDVVTDVGEILRFLTGVAKEAVTHPIEALRTMSEATEEATRIMQYKRAKEAGDTVIESGLAARDVPQDFSRYGSGGKHLNRVKAFFNAGVQSVDKMVREFDPRNPRRAMRATMRAMLSITLPTIALFAINHDNPYYQERPQWEKDLFWLIPYAGGKKFIRWPKPFELGIVFGTIPERFMRWLVDKDRQAFKDLGDTVREHIFLDTLPDADFPFVPPVLFPDALLPVIELYANKREYTRTPIIPRAQQEDAAMLQYGPNTSELAKAIGAGAHKAFNWDVSPYKVDHAIFSYTGPLGRQIKDVGELGLEKTGLITKPPRRAGDYRGIPVLGSFVASPTSGSTSATINRFYDDLQQAERAESLYAAGQKINKEDEQLRHQLSGMRKISRELGQYRKEQRTAINNPKMTDETKKKIIQRTDQNMVNAVRRYYRLGNLSL